MNFFKFKSSRLVEGKAPIIIGFTEGTYHRTPELEISLVKENKATCLEVSYYNKLHQSLFSLLYSGDRSTCAKVT